LGLGVAAAGVGTEVLSTSIISESISIEPMVKKMRPIQAVAQSWMVGLAVIDVESRERARAQSHQRSAPAKSEKMQVPFLY